MVSSILTPPTDIQTCFAYPWGAKCVRMTTSYLGSERKHDQLGQESAPDLTWKVSQHGLLGLPAKECVPPGMGFDYSAFRHGE